MCLLVTELLIWLGNIQNDSSMLCGFTTAFLHCAFLCTISWMFLEGKRLHSHTQIHTMYFIVFTQEHNKLDSSIHQFARSSSTRWAIAQCYSIRIHFSYCGSFLRPDLTESI